MSEVGLFLGRMAGWAALGLWASACGHSRPGAGGPEPADLAASLNLRVVRAGPQDPDLPDPSTDLTAERREDKILAYGNELVFQRNIYLPDSNDPRSLFLVLPDAWLGSQIQSVFVEHRMENEFGRFEGPAERKTAHYLKDQHRWYLPFTAFFSNEGEGADPARQHLLSLDLALSDSTLRRVEVRLRVVGAVPRIRVVDRLNPDSLDPRVRLASLLAPDRKLEVGFRIREGVVVRTSRILNPSDSSLTLWLRAETPAPLKMRSFVGYQSYHQDRLPSPAPGLAGNLLPPVADAIQWAYSEVPLLITEAVVSESGRPAPSRLMLEEDRWSAIRVGPKTEIQVDWLARLGALQTLCHLPPPTSRHFIWNVPCDPAAALSCIGLDGGEVQEGWVVGGSHLSGNWNAGLIATRAWEPAPSAALPLQSASAAVIQGGMPADGDLKPFDCQGSF